VDAIQKLTSYPETLRTIATLLETRLADVNTIVAMSVEMESMQPWESDPWQDYLPSPVWDPENVRIIKELEAEAEELKAQVTEEKGKSLAAPSAEERLALVKFDDE
jgi:hypothetical protein